MRFNQFICILFLYSITNLIIPGNVISEERDIKFNELTISIGQGPIYGDIYGFGISGEYFIINSGFQHFSAGTGIGLESMVKHRSSFMGSAFIHYGLGGMNRFLITFAYGPCWRANGKKKIVMYQENNVNSNYVELNNGNGIYQEVRYVSSVATGYQLVLNWGLILNFGVSISYWKNDDLPETDNFLSISIGESKFHGRFSYQFGIGYKFSL